MLFFATGTVTILGGSVMPPEVVAAWAEAAKHFVDLVELHDKVGARIAKLLGAEAACVTTGEAIEGTDEDLMETLERLIPNVKFRHAHDPLHAPDHMISSIVGPSLTVPMAAGKLALGTWQRILFVECNGPRQREYVLTVTS